MCRRKNKAKRSAKENFEIDQTVPFENAEGERDYFSEFYKAYKNDYVTQYLNAYKQMKAKQNQSDDNGDDI